MGVKRGEQQHRAHPRLTGERVRQLAKHKRSKSRERAAGVELEYLETRMVGKVVRAEVDKPKWLSESPRGVDRSRETSERRGSRPIWERAPGCDPTLAASHGDRVLATRSARAVWSRLFVQLLPPLQCLDAAPAAPRPAVEQTSNIGPDFDGSRSIRRQRAGLASRCGSLGREPRLPRYDCRRRQPWPACRATSPEFRRRDSPDIGFCRTLARLLRPARTLKLGFTRKRRRSRFEMMLTHSSLLGDLLRAVATQAHADLHPSAHAALATTTSSVSQQKPTRLAPPARPRQ
ncbi:uncharacterized protein RHTO_04864 [Rhodotorula toruloides NP11]|uniref:Uncharacterized protein n=1 Tax=Rhodotorula toruloides (strain NP11) TaxID=1130832 RepID=M7XLC9_RHOT1|nr:uncharacterized protein RHTO_04864 [Rhodotorula toruloides NP11]EMS24684.1 hypothetical protein RHTO_04864 [Rhodotorula toruloides NP11]